MSDQAKSPAPQSNAKSPHDTPRTEPRKVKPQATLVVEGDPNTLKRK